jgi:hypothetical protein
MDIRNLFTEHRHAPDKQPLGELQARRLSAISGISAKELAGNTVADLSDRFKWQIDPELFFFRRVCGRVVKKDPATGEERPVPFATVHVEDTDCGLVSYFPRSSPYGWHFPLYCHREEIATAVTDACGNFCVNIPRWEIDWIVRWRAERICFPDIFVRPTVRDLLRELDGLQVEPHRPPHPEPDPGPLLLEDGGMALRRAQEVLGHAVAGRIAAHQGAGAGASTRAAGQLLDQPAFTRPVPPPLPRSAVRAMRRAVAQTDDGGVEREIYAKESHGFATLELASQLRLKPDHVASFDPRRYVGPFLRCRWVLFPEWQVIHDVPDITFRVTQDVDGDGDQETIYSEGYFDVRWNSGPIPPVTLYASQIAVAGSGCETPEVTCQDTPAIQFAGLMPLVNPAGPEDPYYDGATGFARRPNRPHPSGDFADPLPNPLSEAPFGGTLQLYGCSHVQGAHFYRLLYQVNHAGPWVPFTGITWPLYRVVGNALQVHWPVADGNGWYPVIPTGDGWFPPNLLLEWNTGLFQNGVYGVRLEVADGARNPIASSAGTPTAFCIDNSAPNPAGFTELRWRVAGGAWSAPVELICPVITRPVVNGVPANLEFRVSYTVQAEHLRSVSVGGGGCGGGTFSLISALDTAQHWYENPSDNSVIQAAEFALPGAALQGAYSFSITAVSRAFNPSGGDGGHLADWNYDPTYIYTIPTLPVAIVNG